MRGGAADLGSPIAARRIADRRHPRADKSSASTCERPTRPKGEAMNRSFAFASSVVALSVITGCGSPEGGAEGAPPAPDDLVTITMVRLHPDGTSEEVVKRVTRAEEHAEYVAKKLTPAAPSAATPGGAENEGTSSAAITLDG